MRIIAGKAKGRTLATLKGMHTRPTADRVKEAIFSVLGDRVSDARVLDAFAGSGALGLEAISRGAAEAWFMEKDRAAAEICAKNIAALGFFACHLLRGDCLKLLPKLSSAGEPACFDLIFADPPYNRGLLNPLLSLIAEDGWLSKTGVLIAETAAKNSEFLPDSRFVVCKTSVYGDTAVHYCQLK